jgi:hypothetical protein
VNIHNLVRDDACARGDGGDGDDGDDGGAAQRPLAKKAKGWDRSNGVPVGAASRTQQFRRHVAAMGIFAARDVECTNVA